LIRDAGIDGAWVGVIGTLVGVLAGGAIGYFITNLHDRQRRKQEIADLKVSLYAEIADRAARCVNDYLKPWRDLKITSSNSLPAGRVEKFRPTDPVVFLGVAGKIGLLGPTALLAVTQFYFPARCFVAGHRVPYAMITSDTRTKNGSKRETRLT
jgi:hypothetical protein